MRNHAENRSRRNGLLIRWSLVRVRPGEPLSAAFASKTVAEKPQKSPYIWHRLRDGMPALDLCHGLFYI